MKRILHIPASLILSVMIVFSTAHDSIAQTRPSARDLRVDQSDRLLIMKNGSVVRGKIKTISTGHLLSTQRGRILITFNQAHFVADNLNDAYLRFRLEVRNPTVAVHRDLAEWCLRHKLFRQAEREMRDALRLDPENETVRRMLDRVQQQAAQADPKKKTIVKPVTFSNVAKKPEARSLSGLTQMTAKEFVSAIQPLVTSNCANARCHGPASNNDFKLTRVRLSSGTHRIATERNLASMLKFMDLDNPSQSEVLSVAKSSHVGQAMFRGRTGRVQLQNLSAWVNAAADELNPNPKKSRSIASRSERNRPQTVSTAEPASAFSQAARKGSSENEPLPIDPLLSAQVDENPARSNPIRSRSRDIPARSAELGNTLAAADNDAINRRPEQSPGESTQPTILSTNFQKLLKEKQPDAFDPSEFNLQYATQNRSNR
jgi:hypothetical protein